MTELDKGRRGKPQREFYTPGSGPLRKSNLPKDRQDDMSSVTEDMNKLSIKEESKQTKQKRPATEIYIPKQRLALEKQMQESKVDLLEKLKAETKGINNFRNEHKSIIVNNRNFRHGSEPRSFEPRNLEPSGSRPQERVHFKPPVQRGKGLKSLSNLPPRLQKKYLQENGIFEDYQEPKPTNSSGRGRGHGRFRKENFRITRSLTPEKMYNDTNQIENSKKVFDEEKENSTENSAVLESSTSTELPFKTKKGILNWADEVERSIPVIPEPDPTASKEVPVEPKNQPSRGRRKKKRRNSGQDRDRSMSQDHRGPSRNNSTERSWRQRDQRQNDYNCSRTSTPDRFYKKHGSRRNSFCDSSDTRREWSPNRRQGSRKNSTCENHSPRRGRNNSYSENRNRQESLERRNYPKNKPIEENWRLEQRLVKEVEKKQPAGILVLPPKQQQQPTTYTPPATHCQRKLFDPSNPAKPIVVPASRNDHDSGPRNPGNDFFNPVLVPAGEASATQGAVWYNPYSENFQQSHNPQIIRGIAQADLELFYIISSGEKIFQHWDRFHEIRYFLKGALRTMLMTDLRFCEAENVEQHLWKILYYNIIELLRNLMSKDNKIKDEYRKALVSGIEYYQELLKALEDKNDIKLEYYLSSPSYVRENLGKASLALVSAQKIYLCLGDLARYKEQANESQNYGIARLWYMKAHQINPKNGRPYNQLAILAMYTKRRIDAVYYYMRCFMSSYPIHTAKENLNFLFDEVRKKYEAIDRKRKEERAKREKEKMKEKESSGGFRREIWIHPRGGKNLHRTTTCQLEIDSVDEELYSVSDAEVNQRFTMSYLHVHGKIFTKIGLESLCETIVQMLREFRALLQHSPLPVNSTRLLQLLAINMFAIDITQPKGEMSNVGDCRSAFQESALVASLQMFNLILERFLKLFQDHVNTCGPQLKNLPIDCQTLIPAIKVWCDWLTTHLDLWNPPPSCQDFKVGPPGDCWTRLATLVNLLEKLNYSEDMIVSEPNEDSEMLYLPEDATLSGFAPLMAISQEPVYIHKSLDMDLAQNILRVKKILFFGSMLLCGLDPPVLKLQKVDTGDSEYISVVYTPGSQDQTKPEFPAQSDAEVCESMSSSDESDDSGKATGVEEDEAVNETLHNLLQRKGQLERQHRKQQALNKNIQKAITRAEVLTEIEVRPHELVPDTNCFIDFLSQFENLMKILPDPKYPYVIMVPLVVLNELEGLSRGCKPGHSAHHSAMVRESARAAMTLIQKKHPAFKCVTTKGSVLISPTFTFEEGGDDMKNDDKILTTCVNLTKSHKKDEVKEGGRRKLYREVVLLTDDRLLRLKAISRDVPVRTLTDFMKWAGLR